MDPSVRDEARDSGELLCVGAAQRDEGGVPLAGRGDGPAGD